MTDWNSVVQRRRHRHEGQNGSCAQADLLAVSLVGLVGSVMCWRGELPVYSCFRVCV